MRISRCDERDISSVPEQAGRLTDNAPMRANVHGALFGAHDDDHQGTIFQVACGLARLPEQSRQITVAPGVSNDWRANGERLVAD